SRRTATAAAAAAAAAAIAATPPPGLGFGPPGEVDGGGHAKKRSVWEAPPLTAAALPPDGSAVSTLYISGSVVTTALCQTQGRSSTYASRSSGARAVSSSAAASSKRLRKGLDARRAACVRYLGVGGAAAAPPPQSLASPPLHVPATDCDSSLPSPRVLTKTRMRSSGGILCPSPLAPSAAAPSSSPASSPSETGEPTVGGALSSLADSQANVDCW
ncbi:unnamed protein product, partial [Ectocarpus sp. 12 AP-2014]